MDLDEATRNRSRGRGPETSCGRVYSIHGSILASAMMPKSSLYGRYEREEVSLYKNQSVT